MIALSREVVHLQPDPRLFFAAAACATLRISSIRRSRRLKGATRSLRNSSGLPKPGDVVEEVRHVLGDLRVGGEEPEVLVGARGDGVVVAGADVDVAASARRPRGGRRASPSRGSSGSGSRRRRGRRRARAPATTRCSGARRTRAFSSTRQTLCLPFSAASIERRHERRLVARPVHRRLQRDHVRVARGAARTKASKLDANESYGWWTSMSALRDLGEHHARRRARTAAA